MSLVDGRFFVRPPVVHDNLTIFLVLSTTARNEDRFITLDEGLRDETIEILEVGAAMRDETRRTRQNDPPPANEDPFAQTQDTNSETNDSVATPSSQQAPQDQDGFQRQAAETHVVSDNEASPVAHNEVNRLLLLNRSERPLYLMPGEIIVGGDQERAMGRELVI